MKKLLKSAALFSAMLIALFLVFKNVAFASTTIDHQVHADSKVTFLAIGSPSMLKIRGKAVVPKGNLKRSDGKLQGELVVALRDFDTGMKLRNKHMHDKYLKTSEFPEARIILDPLTIPANLAEAKKLPFSGSLELHGQEKKITGVVTLNKVAEEVIADAKFNIDISEFGISIPSFAGITVAKSIEVEANIIAK